MFRKMALATAALALLAVTHAAALDFSGSVAGKTPAAASETAWPLLKLDVDIENNPGWVATIKGGYQWKLFKGVGYTISDNGVLHSKSVKHTKGGAAASLALGYNFGKEFPLTLGLGIGMGPGGKFTTRSSYVNGVVGGVDNVVGVTARQKVRIYNLDASIDYEFRSCSRWSPFVGLIGGVAFTNDKARIELSDAVAGLRQGRYDKQKHTSFLIGARVGTKWSINERVALSLYASYEYLGTVKARDFALTGATAQTRNIKAHQLDVTAGLRIKF